MATDGNVPGHGESMLGQIAKTQISLCGSRSTCASAQSDQGPRCPLTELLANIENVDV